MFKSTTPLQVAKSGQYSVLTRGTPDRLASKTSASKGYSATGHSYPYMPRLQTVANTGFQVPSGSPGSGTSGSRQFGARAGGSIDALTPYIEEFPYSILCDMYTDIYHHDPVSGAVVDMLSNLPFSDFELRMPVEDPSESMRQVFEENIDRLRVNTLFPAAVRERMVYGSYTSLLVYNPKDKVFTDTIPFSAKSTQVFASVLFGGDPTIIVELTPEQQQYMNYVFGAQDRRGGRGEGQSGNARQAKILKSRLNSKMIELLRAGEFELDALSSVHFPNKPFATSVQGTSIYQRILPIYLLEKTLLRGTTHMANRRQNAIVHIQAGGDEWDPTVSELDDLVQKLIEADRDPIGAAIATRHDVNISEIGSPGGGWMWDNIADSLNAKKMMALGVSESFLCVTGDTRISTADGLLRIDRLADIEGLGKDRYRQLDINVKGIDGYAARAIRLWYRGKSRVCTVYSRLGYHVTSTRGHKFLALTEDMDLEWVEAKHLTPKHHLVIDAKGQEILENPIPRTDSNVAEDPTEMSPDLAYCMGMLLAKAEWSTTDVFIRHTDRETLEALTSRLHQLFGVACGIKVEVVKESEYVETQPARWIARIPKSAGSMRMLRFLCNHDVANKNRIPRKIMRSGRSIRLAFLAGFLEADDALYNDGFKHTGSVVFHLARASLRPSLQIMLVDMGYISYTLPNCDQLCLAAPDGIRLCKDIRPYMCSEKRHLVDAEDEPGDSSHGIPVQGLVALFQRRWVRYIQNVGQVFLNDDDQEVLVENFYQTREHIGPLWAPNQHPPLSYAKHDAGEYNNLLGILREVSPVYHRRMAKLFRRRHTFDLFERCVKGKRQRVYDLSIDREYMPAFVANGIVIHNSGDAAYSTLDHALTVFIEQMRSLRRQACNQFFYNKLFPLISVLHDFKTKETQEAKDSKDKKDKNAKSEEGRGAKYGENINRYWSNAIDYDMSYKGSLIIPVLEWEKKLIPEGDAERMDLMDRLAEKGVPFSLRTWAAAGGFSLDQLAREMENSTSLEKRIQEIEKSREKVLGKPKSQTEEFSLDPDDPLLMDQQAQNPYIGLMRDYPEHAQELYGRTKTGKKKYIHNQHKVQRDANRKVGDALTRLHAAGIKAG